MADGKCKKKRRSKNRDVARMITLRNKIRKAWRELRKNPENLQPALWLAEHGITPKNIGRYL